MQTIPANELLAGLTLAEPADIHAVVTDSRKVEPGCVFVCFPGERVDGHAFAAGAYRNGAAYIIANHPVDGVPEDRTVIVPDSARAMIRMASNYRMLFSPKMIGVTGSVGKTTTKEFCYAVLSAFGKTLKTEGNQNNDIGVPNTLFRLDSDTRYAVVEMGMDHLGEIERLTRCARPSAGIITMIGVSHLENLGTRENILKAKMEICAGLPDGAPLALNADNDLLPTASVPARLCPVWFAIESEIADVRAADVQTTGMRQHIVEKGGITFIEDCYNASPDSMKAALSVLKALPNARKIALLGDMLELGDASESGHRETGEWAADAGVSLLIAYGPNSAAMAEAAKNRGIATVHCQTAAEVLQYLQQSVRPGDAVLAKASHAMKLDEILADFYAALPQA